MNQNGEADSDDETLEQIYSFADFNDNTSKMKIKKWLSKSQDNDLNEYEPDYNNSISYNQNNNISSRYPHVNQINFSSYSNGNSGSHNNSPRYQNGGYNNNNNNTNNNENISPRSPRLTRYDETNTNPEIYYDPSVIRPSSKSKRPAPLAPDIDPNHYYNNSNNSLNTFSIKNPDYEKEYEIQTFSIDLLDEMSISSRDYKFFEQIDRVEPKTEARVYVNNPDTAPAPPKPSTYQPLSAQVNNNQLKYSKMNGSPTRASQAKPSTATNKTSILAEQSKSDSPKTNVIHVEQSGMNHKSSILKNSNTNSSIVRNTNSSIIKNKPASNFQADLSKRSASTPRFSQKATSNTSIAPAPPAPPPPPAPPLSQQSSSVPNAPSFPPPPPPPLPQSEPAGLLKFTKKTNKTNENRKMSSLQEELESKLFKVRQSLSENADDGSNRNSVNYKEDSALIVDNVNNILRFDPSLLKTESKKNLVNGHNGEINKSNINHQMIHVNGHGNSNGMNGDDGEFILDPRETFTSKAKKALESYRNTKSSTSSIDGINVRVKSTSSKSKYPPMPSFANEQNGLKFVD